MRDRVLERAHSRISVARVEVSYRYEPCQPSDSSCDSHFSAASGGPYRCCLQVEDLLSTNTVDDPRPPRRRSRTTLWVSAERDRAWRLGDPVGWAQVCAPVHQKRALPSTASALTVRFRRWVGVRRRSYTRALDPIHKAASGTATATPARRHRGRWCYASHYRSGPNT